MFDRENPGLTIDDLGFVLAIDGCARGCRHCSAYSLGLRPTIAPFPLLLQRLRAIRDVFGDRNLREFRTIHAWRISDLLDYKWQATESRALPYDVADLAEAWDAELGQPLYVITNGTIGSNWRRNALRRLAEEPDRISQLKLTVTPFDPRFGRSKYVQNIASDIRQMWALGEMPSQRIESVGQPRFRLNVKVPERDIPAARDLVAKALHTAGIGARATRLALGGDDPRVLIKSVYDLRLTDQQPIPENSIRLAPSVELRVRPDPVRQRLQLGVRPSGRTFFVDLWSYREFDIAPTSLLEEFLTHNAPSRPSNQVAD